MKSLVTLFQQVLDDVGGFCSVNTTRDFNTVTRRVANEGDEFFTRLLPRYGSGLERALDSGVASPDLFPGFGCRQNTPVLFGGFMDLVFDRASGALLDDASTEAIRSLRQLTLMFKKIELQCHPSRVDAAFRAFVQSDVEVGEWEQSASDQELSEFSRLAKLLFSVPLSRVNRKVREFGLEPSHGPGATADRLVANSKYENPTWTERLEEVAPYWRYADFRGNYSTDKYSTVVFNTLEQELPVRVIDVPKTLETPRIIAVEPTCMQFMQQGVARSVKEETDKTVLSLLIGNSSQEPNQLLALEGSLMGNLATLDLSEASDRVSNLLVKTLFQPYPDLHDLVQASRSVRADVPGVGVVPLHRFASMGSALCFPVETMVFLTVVLVGLQNALGIRFTRESQIFELVGRVRIYGDDIIVPVDTVSHVTAALNQYGFKVNGGKSFWTGKFRESCGKEYFAGEDVTICRVRRPLPTQRDHVSELISAVEFRNHAYKRGLWKTAKYLDELLLEIIPMPTVAEASTVLGRFSFLGFEVGRMCPKLHRPQVRGAVVKYRKRYSPINGDAALMKCLGYRSESDHLEWDDFVLSDDNHLQYAGRPQASSINLRWGYSV